MDAFAPLTTTTDMSPGSMKLVSLGGQDYLVARVADEYFVTDSRCPHLGGHLDKGTLQGAVITCPRHGSQFDLRDGRVGGGLTGREPHSRSPRRSNIRVG